MRPGRRDMKPIIFLCAALAGVLASIAAMAQTYPSRPITIVVPTTAGGPPDTIARVLGEHMRATLGQPVIVENVTGAGGTLSIARVARAAPDGYTVSIGHLNSHVFSGATYTLSYDLLKDLDPVTLLTTAPLVLVAKASLPPNDLPELIAWLKANPDKVSLGTVGMGGPARVWGAYFKTSTGTQFQFIPYRGAASIVQDLVAGQIDLACVEGSNVLSHLRGGKIKPYAVLIQSRWAAAPDIPTIDEAGAPGLYMPFWHGLWVPRNTPKDVIAKLNAATVEALADPAVRGRLAQIGQEIFPPSQQTPEALGAFHKAEIEKWWPIIKAANIQAE
jgi:tripartite-type tricarboxylate transporter receptor subunit TctC